MLSGSFVAESPAAPISVEPDRRRRMPRSPHRVPCRVVVDESGIAFIGQTINVSSSGVAVQIGRPLPVGTSVQITIPALDAPPRIAAGRVVHERRVLSGTFELGISLGEADPRKSASACP